MFKILTLKMKSDVCDSDLRNGVIRLDVNIDPLLSLTFWRRNYFFF